MSKRDIYHPRHAIADPEAYYDRAFKNYPRPWLVPVVGHTILALTRPEVTYHDAANEAAYFNDIDPTQPLVLTFTHRGLKKLHDPMSAAGAVFGSKRLREHIRGIRVWGAVPYMTHPKFGPLIERLGSVPVIRSQDYEKSGVLPSDDDVVAVRETLIDGSVDHLEASVDNSLAIFPAGTKGGEKIREGVGMVLARVSRATVLPVALVSDTEQTHDIPHNLRIAFGEPIPTEAGLPAVAYTRAIDENLNAAAASIGG